MFVNKITVNKLFTHALVSVSITSDSDQKFCFSFIAFLFTKQSIKGIIVKKPTRKMSTFKKMQTIHLRGHSNTLLHLFLANPPPPCNITPFVNECNASDMLKEIKKKKTIKKYWALLAIHTFLFKKRFLFFFLPLPLLCFLLLKFPF